MLLGPVVCVASAATLTDVPPFLRGNATLGYSFDNLGGTLQERIDGTEVEVGERSVTNHMLTYGVEFGVGPGTALFIELPHYVASSVSYGTLSEMVYDPATESGTYQGSAGGTAGTYVSGGALAGVWIGARGTPFSEAFAVRQNRATWLLEGALRTGSGNSFWTMSDGEHRGAGPGGTAFRLRSVFATTFGASQPYVGFTWVSEGKTTVDVYGQDGTVLAEQVEVNPADTTDLRAGLEVLAGQNDASGSRLAFDLHLEAHYATTGEVPSGVYLPEVLATTDGTIIQSAEQLEPGAGLGILWRPMSYLQLDITGAVRWHLPQRVEAPYPVYTGTDTLALGIGTKLSVLIR